MMRVEGKLMDMLTDYAASHRHPFNVFVHIIGIPTIMLGVLIPLTWAGVDVAGWRLTAAHVLVVAFCAFYATLDAVFALAFLVLGLALAQLGFVIGREPPAFSGTVAAACFFGGYAAQFVGHAVERSMPVLVRHPIQAQLAAPFFTVVELFRFAGLRDALFHEVERRIGREESAGSA